jgi:DNA-binding transcriptional LysR family regulator
VPIFDRSGHRAVLTAGGRHLLESARDLLTRARQLDAVARSPPAAPQRCSSRCCSSTTASLERGRDPSTKKSEQVRQKDSLSMMESFR